MTAAAWDDLDARATGNLDQSARDLEALRTARHVMTRPVRTREECIAAAGRAIAEARRARDELYDQGGAIAVARAAWIPGGPSVEELAAGWEQIVQDWLRDQAAKAAQ